jgi:acyl-CoA synthetase (AMP-forming)/AMP-acid ligase II
MSLVKARRSPITGAIVVADVVMTSERAVAADAEILKSQILDICRDTLAQYKVPASIRFVSAIEVAASGKLARTNV